MFQNLIIPHDYRSPLDPLETEDAIKKIKDLFQAELAGALNLKRVTAPLIVRAGRGINDDLSGVERPLSFPVKDLNGAGAEVVQSLAKWKRMALAQLRFRPGEGLYTDMNAIRPDEALDNMHSLYVDQWDWERVISRDERNLEFLTEIVKRIYLVFKKAETFLHGLYPSLKPVLPPDIQVVHSHELERRYPDLTPRERENAVCREFGAVFIHGIGSPLKNGRPHDGRAPDYDDWTTPTEKGPGLNGDIIVWYPVLETAMEISSMGIRVDERALGAQLELTGTTARKELLFHRLLLDGKLPLSIGGGIGQSRLCMFLLRKAHIGEVQSSLWPDDMIEECRKKNVFLF
ncbi:MAG: aspartate--ammonia ligase [Acidobacteria bacterium]|nr:aspartate--ammonia ligase [Acidobacteriota bacterium]MBU1473696.1 aspartate--ammonia ligase [Acidobacteriota bacterium]MBU4254580.1 aspartate--ammonia ligase [Acidobacteriota bacterium]MBU4330382.1 aspartate--ammonia ligase [Acidobacteriota bacterium]MCG2816928.1 aspartate--ammonia ligase [Candidatus Aminicenantes bacterium]